MLKFHQFLRTLLSIACQTVPARGRLVGTAVVPDGVSVGGDAPSRAGHGRWIGFLPGLLMVATCVVIFVLLTRGPATTGARKVAASTPARTGLAPVAPGSSRDRSWNRPAAGSIPHRDRDSSPPRLVPIKLPDFEGAYAIWGATGRDVRGHIWVGVSATGVAIPSAHLIEYVPETGGAIDRGDAVTQLKRAGLYRRGRQMKIHSKIVQARRRLSVLRDDGRTGRGNGREPIADLGFAPLADPPGGGRLGTPRAVPEALIAVSGPADTSMPWVISATCSINMTP